MIINIHKTSLVQHQRGNTNGYVMLISVMVVGAIALSVGVGLLTFGLSFSKTSLTIQRAVQAKYYADTCGEEALQQLRDSVSYSGSGNMTFVSGSCTYSVSNSGGGVANISATGIYASTTKRISIVTSAFRPRVIVSSWQEIQ